MYTLKKKSGSPIKKLKKKKISVYLNIFHYVTSEKSYLPKQFIFFHQGNKYVNKKIYISPGVFEDLCQSSRLEPYK